MSSFEIIDNIKYQIGRFLWPAIFLAVGIYLLQMALVPEVHELNNGKPLEVHQSPMFMWGAVLFLVGGVVWILYVIGIIRTIAGYAIMGIMVIFSCILLYVDYKIIETDVVFMAEYNKIDKDIKARMFDIKAAEVAFKEFNKYYTNNIDSLILFVKTGKKMSVPNKGTLPERKITPEERDYIYGDNRPIDKLMTEKEANVLAHMPNPPADLVGFSRDTIYLDVMEAIFLDEKYTTNREKQEPSLAFHPDSLRFIPWSKYPVFLDTSSVQKGDLRVPTLVIKMYHPMDTSRIYQIGDLQENHLRDNWTR